VLYLLRYIIGISIDKIICISISRVGKNNCGYIFMPVIHLFEVNQF
jgi:hypothetical protein